MKNKIITLICAIFVLSMLSCVISINATSGSIINGSKMESELDIYAGASYIGNLRNPVTKSNYYKVVALEWTVNRYRKDFRESMSYSSLQSFFSEDSTYYLRLTLHSLDYPNYLFQDSNDANKFKDFTVSLKVNGEKVELSPYAVDNYDSTCEYIDLIYQIKTEKAEQKVGVTGITFSIDALQVGNSFVFSNNVNVSPLNASNQFINWTIDFDGGTNYCLHTGTNKLILGPKEGYEPKPGIITLIAEIKNGKENGDNYIEYCKIRVVSDMSLQGSAIITSEPTVGEKVCYLVNGDVNNIYNTKYTWEYKNSFGQFDPVTKIKNYGTIDNNILTPGIGLIDKEIRLKITSNTYIGSVCSESKVVVRNSILKTPSGFTCGFSQSSGICARINSDTHLLQEFVMLKSSTPPTEEQWKTLAKSPTSINDLYFNTDENGNSIVGDATYTIYSRFKATEKTNAGTTIISASYYTGFKCKMEVSGIMLQYNKVEYKAYDTIVVDLAGNSSVSFRPNIISSPTNANEWRKHSWKLTGSAKAVLYGVGEKNGPYYTDISSQNGGNEYFPYIKIDFTTQGKYYLSADIDGSSDRYAYFTIVVIDSSKHIDESAVSITPSNIAPTSLTVEKDGALIPAFISKVSIYPVAADKDYRIVFKEATYQTGSYGNPYKITNNDYIDVNETTGQITGIKKTGYTTSEKGYVVMCIYDRTTKNTNIVCGITIVVTEKNHTHALTEIQSQSASCTENGYTRTFYVCGCGEWFTDKNAKNLILNHNSIIINKLDHNYGDFICEIPPTQTSNGVLGHYHCSRCEKNFDASKNELANIIISSLGSICPRDYTCPIERFKDTTNDFWWHDGIHYCVEHGYMNGVEKNLFSPEGTTTRAMIVAILWRMEGSPIIDHKMTFKDVPKNEWYAEAVKWAQSTKVVTGYDDYHFGPEDYITREQMAAILYRYAKQIGINVNNLNTLSQYKDKNRISDWALTAIQWANASGIINGRTETEIVPLANITRAEAATMIQRFCVNVKKS